MSRLFIPDRYELKYLLPEEQVERVRVAIRPFCELDKHSARAADHQYVINSLYLDNPRFELYRVSREGQARRFKVRVRSYGDGGLGGVFLEVKRKANGMVRKSRARLSEMAWQERLASGTATDAVSEELSFWREIDLHGLEPALLVRYEREAWFSTVDDYARVTFDRRIGCQPADGWGLAGDPSAWLALDHPENTRAVPRAVLLELKCTRDVPRWMARLIESLELLKSGYSKYCNGIERVWGHASLRCDPGRIARRFAGSLS